MSPVRVSRLPDTWTITANFAIGVMGDWRGASVAPVENSGGATNAWRDSTDRFGAVAATPVNNNDLQVYFYAAQSNTAPGLHPVKLDTQPV